MSMSKTERTNSQKTHRRGKNRVAEIANTLEWVITAFILAFIFRAFVMEAFRIPTGSMADTLKGSHFRLRCRQCGYRYDHGFVPEKYGLPTDSMPQGSLKLASSRCPSCGYYQRTGGTMPTRRPDLRRETLGQVANGDRILVLKCIYQFVEPKQWDVVVFKNPLEPTINYIKRLIGRPGETVEIIDGDIYIDGQISRKPPNVQKELWMSVYDKDYQPVHPREPAFNNHPWQQPFKNTAESKWRLGKNNPTVFCLDSAADQINSLIYDSSIGNDFRATYAYNSVSRYGDRPYCSDLMVRFYAVLAGSQGRVGAAVSKYQSTYSAWVGLDGDMVIEATRGKETMELAHKLIEPPAINKPALVKFTNVDHRLIFQFGAEKLTYELGRSPDDAGPRRTGIQPKVKIFGSGKLTLSHIAIFRDIHYTSAKFAPSRFVETRKMGTRSNIAGRATEGNPFTLGKDEFFVLGDNSPNSEDGRWWSRKGVGNNGRFYRAGIVPREYLVGKALFVYWPGGFRLFDKLRFAIIPNVGRMRFIYGGSNKHL